MKLVITQMNVGGRLRFIPGGANGTSLHNYPRDGWLTETAAKKWAKQNGHEIVKVEKMAGKGEKTFRIEYTYKDRNGRTKTSSPEFVGTSVEPLKKRIVEGLERNGDKLISFGKITSKDSVDSVDAVEEIREKYSNDVYSPILGKEFSGKGKDFDKALKEKRYEGLYKQIDFYLKHYSKQHKLSDVQMKDLKRLVNEIRSYGKGGERWVNEVKKTVKEFKDSCDDLENIRQKYAKETEDSDDFAQDKLLITSKGFARANEPLKKDTRKGLKPFEVAFIVKGKDGKPFKTMRSKMAASLEEAKRWANQESRKYNGVTKVEVKEFKDEADCVEMLKAKYCNDFVMKNDIVRLPNMASYNVEIKINGQPFLPMMTVRDVEGAKKDKIAKQAMEQFKKFHWNNSNSFNRPLDKSKAKLTVGKIQYKPDGRSNWEVMR